MLAHVLEVIGAKGKVASNRINGVHSRYAYLKLLYVKIQRGDFSYLSSLLLSSHSLPVKVQMQSSVTF